MTVGYGPLSIHTLATNATHAGGYAELDVHNLWGMMEERATHISLQEILPGKRPFLISRSTFPSSGKWTGHWVRVIMCPTSVRSRPLTLCSLATISAPGCSCTSTSRAFCSSSCSRFRLLVPIHAGSVCCLFLASFDAS